jgi:hypothetical protein
LKYNNIRKADERKALREEEKAEREQEFRRQLGL